MSRAYGELEHAADIFVEIGGRNLGELYENALYSLYDHLVELESVELREELTLEARAEDAARTLRGLVGEALYQFEARGFVAGGGRILEAEETRAKAILAGEGVDPAKHGLLREIKAVTYHQLAAEREAGGGWRATLIFDV